MRRPHLHSTTPSTTGLRLESRAAKDHTQHNRPRSEPLEAHDHRAHNPQSAPRAVIPHLHNEQSAPRACEAYHACTTGLGTLEAAQRAFQNRNGLIKPKTRCRSRSPDAERLAVQLPRARRNSTHQKPDDLAREAVGWNFHDRKRSLLTRETLSPSRSALMRYYSSTVDQQFRPDTPLEMIIPCWNLVPNHTRLPHWRQGALALLTPIRKLITSL